MNRLGKLMTMMHPEKTKMVASEEALAGRSERAFEVPKTHAVLGTPLEPPFPAGIEVAYFALGCFWGRSGCSGASTASTRRRSAT